MPPPPHTHHGIRAHTKLAYGLGQIGEQVKTQGFNTFLFFYFTQVLGLSGTLAGAAVLIALVFDALTDPIVGSLSDNWRSARGRRHPFMYAAALPLAIFWTVLFIPPAGLGQLGLFVWLTTFAVLVRGAMTLYHVPHLALGAELSTDYVERTSIVTWRTLLAVGGGVATTVISYALFFPETDHYQNGMLNPAGYPRFALFGSALMVTTIWYSAWGTRHEIPRLPAAPSVPEPFSTRRILAEFAVAWKNASFRAVFLGFTLFGVYFGIITTLGTHMNVFFWGFETDHLQLLALPWAIGFLIAGASIARVHRHIEKAPVLVAACVATGVLGNALVVLRLFGWMPANGSPALLWIVFAMLCLVSTIAAMGIISAGSMMADVAEQHELNTGKAQQGIFFSATSFSSKLASGLGHFVAGLGLDLIAFPLQAEPSTVPTSALTQLGLLSLAAVLLTLFAIAAFRGYTIDRAEHERTRAILGARNAAAAAPHGVDPHAAAESIRPLPATRNATIVPEGSA